MDAILHGDEGRARPLIARASCVAGRCAATPRVVTMEDKPSQVMRHGEGTSMWSCHRRVRNGEARSAVSCGNTGALMACRCCACASCPA
jgi:phosphate acyltransferase